jgi:Domain of unknown function (DUF6089)
MFFCFTKIGDSNLNNNIIFMIKISTILLYLPTISKNMKRKYLILISMLVFSQINAQIHEFGVFAGGSNFIGDIGPTTFIAPNETAFGLLYKWNKSPRLSWRASFLHSIITARDSESDSGMRVERNYAFKNNIKEVSLGLEFNFFEFNLHNSERKFTPYIYSGLSVITFSQLYHIAGKHKTDNYDYSFAIPMVVGVKTNITEHLILGLETGARYTFTDNLDGSNPKKEYLAPLKFGNTNSNDWVVFTGFTLTYTFGRKHCNCNY